MQNCKPLLRTEVGLPNISTMAQCPCGTVKINMAKVGEISLILPSFWQLGKKKESPETINRFNEKNTPMDNTAGVGKEAERQGVSFPRC